MFACLTITRLIGLPKVKFQATRSQHWKSRVSTLTLIYKSPQVTQAGPGFFFGKPLSHSPARLSLKKPGSVRPYPKPDGLAGWEHCVAAHFVTLFRTFLACYFNVQYKVGICKTKSNYCAASATSHNIYSFCCIPKIIVPPLTAQFAVACAASNSATRCPFSYTSRAA